MQYFLLDANVVAGYYLPRSLNSKKARENIRLIFNYVRAKPDDFFLYMPNFCVAEVFSVLMKHSFGTWNQQVREGTIDTRVYTSLVRQFQKDIHNGRFIYHYELSRYHILGINLVAPIDHYYKISRGKKRIVPMGTFDHLIISMGIHLAYIHGRDNVCILSTDDRLTDILMKCKSHIPLSVVEKLKLKIAHKLTGRFFGPKIFPKHLNLKTATKKQFLRLFDEWPLPEYKHRGVYRWTG
jgi:hypothetical protein